MVDKNSKKNKNVVATIRSPTTKKNKALLLQEAKKRPQTPPSLFNPKGRQTNVNNYFASPTEKAISFEVSLVRGRAYPRVNAIVSFKEVEVERLNRFF